MDFYLLMSIHMMNLETKISDQIGKALGSKQSNTSCYILIVEKCLQILLH